MAFIYDGTTCLVDHWNAGWPLVDPEPFNQPFYVCLTQALGIGTNRFIPGTTPLPATTSVELGPGLGNSCFAGLTFMPKEEVKPSLERLLGASGQPPRCGQ